MTEIKKYTELAKPRITDTRKLIISRINKTGGFKFAELVTFKEAGKDRTMILRGGIEISSLKYLRNIRDAINTILDNEGYYETESGTLDSKDDLLSPEEAKELVDKIKSSISNTTVKEAADNVSKMPYFKTARRITDEEKVKLAIDPVTVPESVATQAATEMSQAAGITAEEAANAVNDFEASMKKVEDIPSTTQMPEDEEDWSDWEDEPAPVNNLPEGYEGFKVTELFRLCKERGLKASGKKSRSYYINILEKSVDK